MLLETYIGETFWIRAEDVTAVNQDGTTTPITTGATVTVVIRNPDGTQFSTDTATATNDDWSIAKNAPTVAGTYPVEVTIVKSGTTGKRKGQLRVKGF